jgi:hypothetical protein
MEIQQHSERENWQVIMLRAGADEVLLEITEAGAAFPSLKIPKWQRSAENLTAAVRSKWGCEAVCLFTPVLAVLDRDRSETRHEVMECWRDQDTTGTKWLPIGSLSARSFGNQEEFQVLKHCLDELDRYERDPLSPFAKRGWLGQLRQWIAFALRPSGFRITGPLRQYNSAPAFNLTRFETTGPAVWFKAVGQPNLREFPITLELAKRFPKFLPQMIGTKPEWNGWLTREASGIDLSESPDLALWTQAAADLATLQLQSIANCDAIFNAGAHDLRLRRLLYSVGPFFELMERLMEEQPRIPPSPLRRDELRQLKLRVIDALVFLEGLELPDTLGHLDLNPGNIVVADHGCVFLDWAEACVGPPLFGCEYLAEHYRRGVANDPAALRRIHLAGEAPWRPLLGDDVVDEIAALAPLVAVFGYAAGTGVWKDEERLREPKAGAYLRSLTRRMHAEATKLSERRSACLS